jgi:hypothetical protein
VDHKREDDEWEEHMTRSGDKKKKNNELEGEYEDKMSREQRR